MSSGSYDDELISTKYRPLFWAGAAMVILILAELINKRQLLDVIFLVLMGVVLIAVAIYYIAQGSRRRRSEARVRAKARALRTAKWEPFLGVWEGKDAVLLRRVSIVDDELVESEPQRLFSPIEASPASPFFDGEVAEVMGRAELRAGTMNARI